MVILPSPPHLGVTHPYWMNMIHIAGTNTEMLAEPESHPTAQTAKLNWWREAPTKYKEYILLWQQLWRTVDTCPVQDKYNKKIVGRRERHRSTDSILEYNYSLWYPVQETLQFVISEWCWSFSLQLKLSVQ